MTRNVNTINMAGVLANHTLDAECGDFVEGRTTMLE